MGKNESFGEQALYYNTQRQCSVKALDEVSISILWKWNEK